MNRTNVLLAASVLLSMVLRPAVASDPPAGFTALFNGKDLSGWRGRQRDYSPYKEAALTTDEQAAAEQQRNRGRFGRQRYRNIIQQKLTQAIAQADTEYC